MSGKEGSGFNNTKNRELGEKSTEQGWKSELVRREQEEWKNTLSAHVEVKPLPDSVTPEVRRNLERMGFGLRYIPALDLGNIAYLRKKGVDEYLAKLQRKYPKWKQFESLSWDALADHTIPRNLDQWFWKSVRAGEINFPVLAGQWMAVETIEKPEYGTKYPRTPFAETIRLEDDRFSASWYNVDNAFEREKPRFLSYIEVSGRSVEDLRFLEAIE
jgi:hypothetical protein